MTIDYRIGPALDVVRTLPDNSIDLVATSPPFLALRNYNDLAGQWGSEASPAEFLSNLLELTTELRRVLTPHGSIAVELGDTYSGSGGSGGDYNSRGLRDGQAKFSGSAAKRARLTGTDNPRPPRKDRWVGCDTRSDWPLAKSLCLVPTLFPGSLAYGRNLLDSGHEIDRWRIRNVIVWARNNPPVGALGDKVRPATSYITVATPSKTRWFDLDAIRSTSDYERVNTADRPTPNGQRPRAVLDTVNPAGSPPTDFCTDEVDDHLAWLVNSQGSKLAHYAMWPPALADRLVQSMCPLEVCRTCGEPRRRQTSTSYVDRAGRSIDAAGSSFVDHSDRKDIKGRRLAAGELHISSRSTTTGWTDCGHDDYRPGVVLDPFAGTGTTLAVASVRGRDAIGIDLDPTHREIYEQRLVEVKKALLGVDTQQLDGQTALFDEATA